MTALSIAHYTGWAILGCMAVLSAWIVAPGLLAAIRIVFPTALPSSPSADPQPRVKGSSARPTIQGVKHGH